MFSSSRRRNNTRVGAQRLIISTLTSRSHGVYAKEGIVPYIYISYRESGKRKHVCHSVSIHVELMLVLKFETLVLRAGRDFKHLSHRYNISSHHRSEPSYRLRSASQGTVTITIIEAGELTWEVHPSIPLFALREVA